MTLRTRIPRELACGLLGVSCLLLSLLAIALRFLRFADWLIIPVVIAVVVSLVLTIGSLLMGVRSLRQAGWRLRRVPRKSWVLIGTLCSISSLILYALILPLTFIP